MATDCTVNDITGQYTHVEFEVSTGSTKQENFGKLDLITRLATYYARHYGCTIKIQNCECFEK